MGVYACSAFALLCMGVNRAFAGNMAEYTSSNIVLEVVVESKVQHGKLGE